MASPNSFHSVLSHVLSHQDESPPPVTVLKPRSNSIDAVLIPVQDGPPDLPPVIPPYWQSQVYNRSVSRTSVLSIAGIGKPQPILLEDHSEEPEGVKSPLWAKVVSIDSHTIVSGNVKGLGDYVVWSCRIDTLDVSMSALIS